MITPAEYIKNPNPENATAWLYMPEVMEHIFLGNTKKTAFKHDYEFHHHFLADLKTDMGRPLVNEGFNGQFTEHFIPKKKHREVISDIGELNIDRYLANERNCFDEVRTLPAERSAKTIILDAGIAAGERDGREIAERHRKIYAMAAAAEGNNEPLRVIAVFCMKTDEFPVDIRFFIIIKDYDDPIFPGIWSAFKDNESANDLLNCFMRFVVGTIRTNNGYPINCPISKKDFGEDEEVILIDCKKVRMEG